tara:strand:+ start:1212 stop:1442 length:231 start_codon:yes stop_codon:yes gene_type:complete
LIKNDILSTLQRVNMNDYIRYIIKYDKRKNVKQEEIWYNFNNAINRMTELEDKNPVMYKSVYENGWSREKLNEQGK